MTVFIGILSAIIGALVGTVATYLTTRSTMRRTLEHAYDRTMQEKRLERYQALFRVTKCLPRHQPPTEQEPSRNDLRRYMGDFHNWYFGADAGGMFLTPAAKGIYIRLMNQLAESAFKPADGPDDISNSSLSPQNHRSCANRPANSDANWRRMSERHTRPASDGRDRPRSPHRQTSATDRTPQTRASTRKPSQPTLPTAHTEPRESRSNAVGRREGLSPRRSVSPCPDADQDGLRGPSGRPLRRPRR